MPTHSDAKQKIAKLGYRAELRSSGEEELSDVIDAEATRRTQSPTSSTPAPAKGIIAILNAITDWRRLVFALALLGLVGYAVGHGFKFW